MPPNGGTLPVRRAHGFRWASPGLGLAAMSAIRRAACSTPAHPACGSGTFPLSRRATDSGLTRYPEDDRIPRCQSVPEFPEPAPGKAIRALQRKGGLPLTNR